MYLVLDIVLVQAGSDPSQQMTQCVGLILSSTNWRVRPSIPLALLPYPASLYSSSALHPDRKSWDIEKASFSLSICSYQTLVYILQRKPFFFCLQRRLPYIGRHTLEEKEGEQEGAALCLLRR